MVLGCDPSTKLIALADEQGDATSIVIDQLDRGSARLADVYEQTRRLTRSFLDGRVPELAIIEQPAGTVHPALWQCFGAVRAAIWGELSTVAAYPVSVWAIMPTEWKALIEIGGGADKAKIMAWAKANGYVGRIQDEADAYGVAVAGHKLLAQGL